jgi:hypothetical protein
MTSKFSYKGITLDNYISSVTSNLLVSTNYNFGITNVASVFNTVVVEAPTKTGYLINGTDVANYCIAKYTELTATSSGIVIPTWCNKIRAVLVGQGGTGGTSVVNPVPGNAIPGNTVPGNTVPGNPVPGNVNPTNTVPGNIVPGNPYIIPGNTNYVFSYYEWNEVNSNPGIESPTQGWTEEYTWDRGPIFVHTIYVASGTNPETRVMNSPNYNPTTTVPGNTNPTNYNPTNYNPTTTNPSTTNPTTYNYAGGGGGGGGAFYYLNTSDITNTRNINLAINTANTVLTVGNTNYTAAAGSSGSNSTIGNGGVGTPYTGNAGSGITGGNAGHYNYTNSNTIKGYGAGGSGGAAPTSGTSTNPGSVGGSGYCRIYFLSN